MLIGLTSQILSHNDSCKAIITATEFLFTSEGALNDALKVITFFPLKVGWKFGEDITDMLFNIMQRFCR